MTKQEIQDLYQKFNAEHEQELEPICLTWFENFDRLSEAYYNFTQLPSQPFPVIKKNIRRTLPGDKAIRQLSALINSGILSSTAKDALKQERDRLNVERRVYEDHNKKNIARKGYLYCFWILYA